MNKKFKVISYIILIAISIIFGYVIYSKATENKTVPIEEKTLAEVKFLETKIIDFSNQLNNIILQNYKVTTTQIKEDQSSSEKESKDSEESKQEGETKSKEYNLEKENSLSKKENIIDWKSIKTDFQEIYTSMPTITLDLYQTNINQEDILNFNKDLDDVAINIKNEDKQKTIESLCNLYSYIVKFTQVVSKQEAYTKTIECKEYILKAYSQIDVKNWKSITSNIQEGTIKFSSLLTNANLDESKQYNINKVYVVLNEIKNASNKEDKEIFLLKYKKLLEEMKSI